MITAEEARRLSGMTADELLKPLEDVIKAQAEMGNREAFIRSAPYANWAYSLYDDAALKPEERKALETLRENGFNVTRHYNEGQFVDIALIISWDQAEEEQP